MAMKCQTARALACTTSFVLLAFLVLPWSSVPITFAVAGLPEAATSTPGLSRRPNRQSALPAASTSSCRPVMGFAAACGVAIAAGYLAGIRSRQPHSFIRVRRRGWGDDVKFETATIKDNVLAADGLRLISIDAPADITTPFTRGGQFVQAKSAEDAKPSFYAISSPPGAEGPLEFLIKEAESNEWLTKSGEGDQLLLSPAMGKGFDLACEAWASAEVSQVGVFATGSGIAPMRAVIESGALDGKVSRFYVGARTSEAMAYGDRFDAWKRRGVEVVPVLSKGGDSWSGRSGYVQEAFRQDEERGEGFVLAARHGAVLCGQKEMVQAVRQVYADLGVPEDRTLLNF